MVEENQVTIDVPEEEQDINEETIEENSEETEDSESESSSDFLFLNEEEMIRLQNQLERDGLK